MDLPAITFEKFLLDNGMTVIVHEDHKAPVVAVSIWYHVGSANEPSGKTGFAHLFEHLMFSGSENHRGVFFRPFEIAGATDQNGTTSFDRTNYFETVPTTALDMALWMESDRMGHLLGAIGQTELDTQRGVVQNEKRQNENMPYGRVFENLLLNAFPANHPYQHLTIGSMADLDLASLEDVRQWFRTYYGAANTTLVLAGDIIPQMAMEKARVHFGDISPGPPIVRPAPWTAPRHRSTRGTLFDQVPQTRLLREWNVPGLGNPDAPLLDLISVILGGGATSRLVQRLVYRDKLADSVSINVHTFALAGMFILAADVRNGVDPALVEAAVEEEWKKFLADGPIEDELLRARTSLQAQFVRRMEKVGGFTGKAVILAEGQVYQDDPAAYLTDFKLLKDATPATVLAVAKRWLTEGDYTLTVKPVEAGVDPRIAAAATKGLPLADDKPAPVAEVSKKYVAAEMAVDRSRGVPEVRHFPELSFPAVQRARLQNGIEIVLAERHAIPVAQVKIQFDAGLAADLGRKLGTARTTISMLDEGTKSCDALEIAMRQQRLGAAIQAGSGLDVCSVAINALNSNLTWALDLLGDVVRFPAFRDVDLERIRGQTLARIKQEQNDPASLGNRLLPPLLYGRGHAYGMPFSGIGTERSIGSLTPADLSSFHQDFFRPDTATIFVAGDTKLEIVMPMLERIFGDWVAPSSLAPVKNLSLVSTQPGPRVLLVHRAESIQSQIIAGVLVAPTSSPDYLATQVANTVFAGSFTSRLNMNLREDKRWTYGARSSMSDALGPRLLFISAAVQTDKTAESVHEILKELEAIASSRPPTSTEIDKVKAQRIRTLPGSYETLGAVLDTLSTNKLYGRPDNYAVNLRQNLEALAESDIADAARRLFVPDAFTWIVVGDLSKIERSIRALNVGEVFVMDASENADQ